MTTYPIDPHPDAPDGSVATLSAYHPSDFTPTDAILCRLNAPLVAFAFDLIRRDVPCHINGRDLAEGLETLLDKITKE